MREVHRSAIVSYSTEQMFDLVVDVERYPEFLPWCVAATVEERRSDELRATLEMERAGRRERFTTRNRLNPPSRMELALVSGPFRVLEGVWTFIPIADRGSRIALEMRFDFANPLVSLVFSRTFEESCNALIDAFTRRARSVYV
jgi:ribosome-associated toxin RatA of RatAB toxin-antitoxin module